METEKICIPEIDLKWSNWVSWNDLKISKREKIKSVDVPKKPGVYEVKYIDQKKRLTIGQTNDLQRRIQTNLVKDNGSHSSGRRISANEDVSKIVVRWAETDRPAAVEEYLHYQYYENFSKLPEYAKNFKYILRF